MGHHTPKGGKQDVRKTNPMKQAARTHPTWRRRGGNRAVAPSKGGKGGTHNITHKAGRSHAHAVAAEGKRPNRVTHTRAKGEGSGTRQETCHPAHTHREGGGEGMTNNKKGWSVRVTRPLREEGGRRATQPFMARGGMAHGQRKNQGTHTTYTPVANVGGMVFNR